MQYPHPFSADGASREIIIKQNPAKTGYDILAIQGPDGQRIEEEYPYEVAVPSPGRIVITFEDVPPKGDYMATIIHNN